MTGALTDRVARAKVRGETDTVERGRRGLLALIAAEAQRGATPGQIAKSVATGAAASQIARVGLGAQGTPTGLACQSGCAFCCILTGQDGGLITEYEARALHAALAPLAGQPDGRDWHPKACPSLDPETRMCRAYDARPALCRSYVSVDVAACEAVAEGTPQPGPGTLGPYHAYLAAIAVSRVALKGTARVATYALSKIAAAAVDGAGIEDALRAARHKTAELDAEVKRSARDTARAQGLP